MKKKTIPQLRFLFFFSSSRYIYGVCNTKRKQYHSEPDYTLRFKLILESKLVLFSGSERDIKRETFQAGGGGKRSTQGRLVFQGLDGKHNFSIKRKAFVYLISSFVCGFFFLLIMLAISRFESYLY